MKGYKLQPKGAKAADSLLKLAFSLGEINKTKEACSMLTKLDKEFPKRAAASKKKGEEAWTKFNCEIDNKETLQVKENKTNKKANE